MQLPEEDVLYCILPRTWINGHIHVFFIIRGTPTVPNAPKCIKSAQIGIYLIQGFRNT